MFFNPKEKLDTVKYNGVLNVLDVHSRKAWSEPFKKKKAEEIKILFEKIINRIEEEKGKGIVRQLVIYIKKIPPLIVTPFII
eukprot:SAG31_NODE_13_length_37961_cov_21.751307_33_plen_82_part_00